MVTPHLGRCTAVAIDPSFIPKSGKQTPGISYFWSGCAGKTLRGLEILGISVIDAQSKMSFHLQATQTVPTHILHNHDLTLADWYAAVIKNNLTEIRSISRYIVADAFFSKRGFADQLLEMELDLVSRLRDDADLLYINQDSRTRGRGRPAKYRGKVDPTQLNQAYFEKVENDFGVPASFAVVYSKALKREIILVVEEFVVRGKVTYRLLFSTNPEQSPQEIIAIYHTRFQMEFGFYAKRMFM